MQCVLLLVWVALAAGQRIFRYDGTVVDQSDSQPVFTSSQPLPLQPFVIQRLPSVTEAPVFVEPQQVFMQPLSPQPDVFLPSRQTESLQPSPQQPAVIVDPQPGLLSPALNPRLFSPFQPESNLIIPENLPINDRRTLLISLPQPAPEVFVSPNPARPQPSGIVESLVFESLLQPESTIVVQPQPPVANLPMFLPAQPVQPQVMAVFPPQPSTLPPQPQSSIVLSPQPVLGSNFANPAAVSVRVQAGCDSMARPLVDQVVGRESWHFSWCHQPDNTFTWRQAHDYCSSLGRGFLPVSIENQLKDSYVTAVMSAHRRTSIWTSGNRLRTALWSWSTGFSSQYTNWSTAGRLGLPQPDNAEGDEFCLAVRYSYSDGAGWHDEPCTSSSFVICQSNGFV